jgi:hypothetical protein
VAAAPTREHVAQSLTPLPAAAANLSYPLSAWDEEAFAAFAEGRDPGACPACGRVGFYGPRVVGAGAVRFRCCRFCGFYQAVDEAPTRAQPTAHDCAEWPEIARARYIWWAPPGQESYRCPFCGATVAVTDHLVTGPSDDRDHPWWRVPQGKTRFYYARFWENWPYTKGRVFL